MAFFDDLGKKISQAGQTAVQKTKTMTDIARINAAISEEEKKVNNSYFQIGRLYVAVHSDNYEDDFSGMILALKASETKIRELRQQIHELKGIVNCEKCGAEVPNSSAFCSSCGAPMPVQADADTTVNLVKCNSCGAMVSENMRFCTTCGSRMTEIIVTEKDQPEEPQESVKTCPNCGAAVEAGLSFCSECGTKQ